MLINLRNVIMQWAKEQQDIVVAYEYNEECTIHCSRCNCRIAYVHDWGHPGVLVMHMSANDMKARYGNTAVDTFSPFQLLASHPKFFDNLADVISRHPCTSLVMVKL